MKKTFLTLFFILAAIDMCVASNNWFEIDQLHYTIISEEYHQVEVSGTLALSGDIEIPAEVIYNSATYTVTAVRYYGFNSCRITSVSLPPTVEKLDFGAFYNCKELTSITLCESLKEIGPLAFSDCTSLTSIDIPESVTMIGDVAFFGCTRMTSINLSNSVETIGQGAFQGCSNLASLKIPSSLTEIGQKAFYLCESMTEITVDDDNQHFSSVDGMLYDKEKRVVMVCPAGKSGEIVLPESVERIGNGAFAYCGGITSIVMPSSVTSIGEDGFGSCTSLSSIALPPSVTSIGNYAFVNCPLLTSINIPGAVTEIGELVFLECSALEEINVDSDNHFFSSYDGVLMDKDKSVVISCPYGKKGEFTVPNSVILIGDGAFKYCPFISSVIMPASVTDIGIEAFMECKSLGKVVMPGVVWINHSAFLGCSGLDEIKLPNSIREICYAAFSDCTGLTSVDIPESLKTLTNGVFAGCTNLSSVHLPEGLKRLGDGTFIECISLSSIHLPSTLNRLDGNPFKGCINLAEISVDDDNEWFCSVDGVMFDRDITKLLIFPAGLGGEYFIPETVTEIVAYAFSGCQYISVLHIPASVKTIGHYGFRGLTELNDIYCAGEKPAWTSGNQFPFTERIFEEAVLYVPEGFQDVYRRNHAWGRFRDIRTFLPSGISDVDDDADSDLPIVIYDMRGVNVGNDIQPLRPGVYVVRQGAKTKKVILK